jgi:hypothetical protein
LLSNSVFVRHRDIKAGLGVGVSLGLDGLVTGEAVCKTMDYDSLYYFVLCRSSLRRLGGEVQDLLPLMKFYKLPARNGKDLNQFLLEAQADVLF